MSSNQLSMQLHKAPTGALISSLSLPELQEQANDAALDQARTEGIAMGKADATSSGCEALEAAVTRLDHAREDALTKIAAQSIQLAVGIASEILKHEIRQGNYNLEAIVRGALDQAGTGRKSVVVHVSPEDAEVLKEVTFRRGTEIAPDPELSRGDVHIDTPRGVLVRSTTDALDTIKERLLEEFA